MCQCVWGGADVRAKCVYMRCGRWTTAVHGVGVCGALVCMECVWRGGRGEGGTHVRTEIPAS